jgi:hypothetical protein
MNDIEKKAYAFSNGLYLKGIKPLIVEEQHCAYIKDLIFGIKRNRVITE